MSSLIDRIVEDGNAKSDYRFFFDCFNLINGQFSRTDDLHYYLYRFLKDRNRHLLVAGMMSSGKPIGGRVLDFLHGNDHEARARLPLPDYQKEHYQDVWVRGEATQMGIRACAERYDLIASYLRRFQRRFSVFDLGANLAYFSLRIAEDFDAVCLCAEHDYAEWLSRVLQANGTRSVYAVQQRLTLEDLKQLAEVEQFDVVLAMSILHHFEAPAEEVLDALRQLGRHVILELPTEEAACGGAWLESARKLDVSGLEILGSGQSHLNGPDRPIIACPGYPARIVRAFLASPKLCDAHKLVITDEGGTFEKDSDKRPFVSGFNAHTFFYFGGFYPSADVLLTQLAAARPERPHFDLAWWNVVFGRDSAVVIDPNNDPTSGLDDDMQYALMTGIARLSAVADRLSDDGHFGFGAGGNGCPLLVSGWSTCENWGVWSTVESAALVLPGPILRTDGRIWLELVLPDLPATARGRRLSVQINGERVHTIDASEPGARFIDVAAPHKIWNRANPTLVNLEVDCFYVPSEEAGLDDNRRLGVGLRSAWIHAGTIQTPSVLDRSAT